MTLKTATLLALIGTVIQFLWMLAMWIPRLHADGAPLLHRFGMIPTLLFHLSLILFFATLLRKQSSPDGAA